jgi:transposase-like protein
MTAPEGAAIAEFDLIFRWEGPMPDCEDKIFFDESLARDFIERMRWPDGPSCTRCGSRKVIRMGGRTQAGMLLCRECRNKFTCRIGTSMEHSHVQLHKWLRALLSVTTGDRRLSPQRLKRDLDLGSYRTAWLMAQRIREAVFLYRQDLEKRLRHAALDPAADEAGRGRAPCVRELDFYDVARAIIACAAKPPERPTTKPDAAPKGLALPVDPVAPPSGGWFNDQACALLGAYL